MKRGHEACRKQYPLIGNCERCSLPATERHHIDGDSCNNLRKNVQFLCRRCHMAIDGRLEASAKRATRMNKERRKAAPKYCSICNKPVSIGSTKNGRCKSCDTYWRRNNRERPYIDGTDGRRTLGKNHSKAKLTKNDVRFIRKSNITLSQLANKFSMNKRSIWCVKARRTWKYVV